ncbi:MAG: four helix bundle protein [Patescibacteria group bacterium]|nr:four helix bundle protein [Patescibacteria group bacterium]
MNGKIKNFMDLIAWQEGHKLVMEVYRLIKKFPKFELFVLVNQICRAAVSVTSSIAEGFSRRTNPDKIRFYTISQGSLTELQNQLLISKDNKYITQKEFDNVFLQTITVQKLINGLIRKLR